MNSDTEDTTPKPTNVGSEVRTRSGTFPSIPYVKQEDGSWKPKYEYSNE